MWLEVLTDEQRQALLRLAHNVIVSDGVLHPNEELLINEFRREMDLHQLEPIEYIDLKGLEATFDSSRSRSIAILNLIHISYVDGAFEIEEECLLRQLARQFEIDEPRFLLMDNWVRRMLALEQEARSFM